MTFPLTKTYGYLQSALRSLRLYGNSFFCDCLRLFAIVCDRLQSYGNQPLDRTWFYLLRSSAITIAGSETIAEVCFHMIADDRRPYCDLRSAICDLRSYGNQPLVFSVCKRIIVMNSPDTRFSRNVFEAVQKTRCTCFIGSKTILLRLVVLNPDKTLLLVFETLITKVPSKEICR